MYELKNRPRKARKVINIHQNKFPKGYLSTIDETRRPLDSLSDMYNMEVVQDSAIRPRPSTVRYGTQPTLPVIGRGAIRVGGLRKNLFMMDDSGTGKLYRQEDGGAFTLIGGTYDNTAWASCVQSKGNAYIFNGVDNLSYVTLSDDSVHVFTELATPSAPTPTLTGMAGTSVTHYYKITALNDVGESIASAAATQVSGKARGAWVENTDYIKLTWSAVTNATGYAVYYGTKESKCELLFTTEALTYTDYGTLATNLFKLAPEGNSTKGAVFEWMHVDAKNSQIYGITADNKLYYSAAGTDDFSPYNGGGWVTIDEDGATKLNYVDSFRNGKGDPVITVSARGAAGKGKLFHMSFESITVGDTTITYPNVYEANGQSGIYSARGTSKAKDSLYYFNGREAVTTGTAENVMNILNTKSIANGIEPDLDRISLENLHKSVSVEYRDKIYWSLPVGSTENNEIWYMDLARNNMWVLRWSVAAKDLWLYEDNSGYTHFCALVDNKIMEFTRVGSKPHTDDGVAFRSRVAFESLVWDKDGIMLGRIRNQYYKLLQPRGTIAANATGLSRKGVETVASSDVFTVTTTPTGIGQWMYGSAFDLAKSAPKYGDDPGEIKSFGKNVAVLKVNPKGLLALLDWEVVAETSGTDYILSAVNTRGFSLDELVLKA